MPIDIPPNTTQASTTSSQKPAISGGKESAQKNSASAAANTTAATQSKRENKNESKQTTHPLSTESLSKPAAALSEQQGQKASPPPLDKLHQPVSAILKTLGQDGSIPNATKLSIQKSLQAFVKQTFSLDTTSKHKQTNEARTSAKPSSSRIISPDLQGLVKAAIDASGVLDIDPVGDRKTTQWQGLEKNLAQLAKQIANDIYTKPAHTTPEQKNTSAPPQNITATNNPVAKQLFQNLDISKFFLLASSGKLLDDDFLHKPLNTTKSSESPTVGPNKTLEAAKSLRAGIYQQIAHSVSQETHRRAKAQGTEPKINNRDANIATADKTTITKQNISDAKLIRNEVYQAEVIKVSPPKLALSGQISIDAQSLKPAESEDMLYRAILKIAGRSVVVATALPLTVGTNIPVKIDAQQQLFIPQSPTPITNTLLNALNAVMPYQQNLAPALEILNRPESQQPLLSSKAQTLANQLLSSLSKSKQFSETYNQPLAPRNTALNIPAPKEQSTTLSTTIKRAIQQSGIFAEKGQRDLVQGNQAGALKDILRSNATNGEQHPAKNTHLAAAHLNKNQEAKTNAQPNPYSFNTKNTNTGTSNTPQNQYLNPQKILTGLQNNGALPNKIPSITRPKDEALLSSDLKIQISKLIAVLKQEQQSKGQGKLLAGIQTVQNSNLAVNPFNFPQLSAEQSARQDNTYREAGVGLLLRMLASALNRIQFHQLSSLQRSTMSNEPSETAQNKSLQMEIPILGPQHNIDLFQLRIEEKTYGHAANNKDEAFEKQWLINLAFDLAPLGQMYVQAKLVEHTLSTHIWADNSQALQMIQREGHTLRERLQEQGLEIGEMVYQQGKPQGKETRITQHLVNTNA